MPNNLKQDILSRSEKQKKKIGKKLLFDFISVKNHTETAYVKKSN